MSGRFADSFWGDKDDGFAVLLARMKQGKNTTQEVLDIIATRISIEEEYSKKIHKLARSITAKDEVGTLKQGLEAMRTELEQVGNQHQQLSAELKSEVEKPLSTMLHEQSTERKHQAKIVEKSLKTKKAQISLVEKVKKNYDNKMKESEVAADQASKGAGGKDAEKLSVKSKKATQAAEQADTEYQNAIEKLKTITAQWENEHSTACDKFQNMEEERIQKLQEFMKTSVNLLSRTCGDDDQCCQKINEYLDRIDVSSDIALFVSERQTGSSPPAILQYEPYGTERKPLQSQPSQSSITHQKSFTDEPKKQPVVSMPPQQMATNSSKILFNVRVLYDYEPQGDEELELAEGEIIPVISDAEDPWWEGEKSGRTGMFPSNFVEKL